MCQVGILYLDEAGNTGLWDNEQKLLIYGGPFVTAKTWKLLSKELARIQAKYKAKIISRFKSGIDQNMPFSILESGVTFLADFNFHAKNIVNRKSLWSKLDEVERFELLDEVITALIKYRIPFYVGSLDKTLFRPRKKPKKNDMREYKILFEQFLPYIERDLRKTEDIVTVIDDGDSTEKDILREALRRENLSKFIGELISGKYNEYPLLQVADIGIWVIQAYHRLQKNRDDEYAEHVRKLYKKLSQVKRGHRCEKKKL